MAMRSLMTGISVAFFLVGAARQPRADANPRVSGQAGNTNTPLAGAAREYDRSPPSRAPENIRAAPGNTFADVRWDAVPGSTGSTVIVFPGGATIPVAGSATSVRVNGLVNGTSYTFTVKSSTGSVSRPSSPVTPSAQANVIADVAFHPQERPLTCEAAALRMVLEHQGIVRSEATIFSNLEVDRRPAYVDASGTLHWGNPYTSFVGDPDGSERAMTGYGTYYPTIARVARGHGATVLRAGENIAPATLYTAILASHPAVVWVSNDWTYHAESTPWVTFDGEQLSWHGPVEHAISLVGVTSTHVLVNNPAHPTDWQWVPKHAFEDAYRTFGQMAIILR
jgi:uncharacterized protein YvpB